MMQFSSYLRNVLKVNQHIPMIRFRKGQQNIGHIKMQPAATVTPSSSSHSSSVVLDDYNLPPRFRRTLLDQDEIDSINSGGCPKEVVIEKKKK